jgi:Pyruvate/2-oxoacid:ferredoxin oxidoreductase delta subunit
MDQRNSPDLRNCGECFLANGICKDLVRFIDETGLFERQMEELSSHPEAYNNMKASANEIRKVIPLLRKRLDEIVEYCPGPTVEEIADTEPKINYSRCNTPDPHSNNLSFRIHLEPKAEQ